MLYNDETEKIAVARPYNVPVFIDSAYGSPWTVLNIKDMTPVFGENIVYCMSFSIETSLNRLTEVVQHIYQEAVVPKIYLSLFHKSSYEQSEKFISLSSL